MLDFIMKTGFDLFETLIHIIAGSIISIILYYVLRGRLKVSGAPQADFFIIPAAAVLGMLMPVNTYGILPVFFMFLQLGMKANQILPVLFSNFIFNMTIPFNDATFVFRTGYVRVLFALLTGIAAGIIFKLCKSSRKMLWDRKIAEIPGSSSGINLILKTVHNNISRMGIYMISGVIINIIFNDYIMYTLTSQVANNSYTAFIPRAMARFNVVSPPFLLALCIIFAVMNITNLSAVFMVFKPKGMVLFIGYYLVWTLLLGITIFF